MRETLSIVAFAGAVLFSLASAYFWWRLVQEVNEKLARDERVSYFLALPGQFGKVVRLHKQMFPDSSRLQQYLGSLAAAIVLGLIWMWASGFSLR
jgi:hypothetical protein